MKVVIHTGQSPEWTGILARPWPLVPVANRPWIEFWIEWCSAHGLMEIVIVLGDGAHEIETYLGDGRRWGVTITYSFLRDDTEPDAFLRRDPARWAGGLLYVRRPVFPRRTSTDEPVPLPARICAARRPDGLDVALLPDAAALDALLADRDFTAEPFPENVLVPHDLASLQHYFDLNMAMVDGEIARYLTPGYRRNDNAYLGFNVIYPASTAITPPVMIGNDVRLRALASIGPRVILGNRIIVDRQADVADTIVLDGTYLGTSIELKGRIVAGRRLIDPTDGTAIDLDDTHLLAPLRTSGSRGEKMRRLAHRAVALLLMLATAPIALPLLLIGMTLGGKFISRPLLGVRGPGHYPAWLPSPRTPGLIARLSLDRWPSLFYVALGRLWLCGQSPVSIHEKAEVRTWPTYRPGLFTYADLRPADDDPSLRRIEAAYYAHHRGWREDANILLRGWWNRLAGRHRPGVLQPDPTA